MLKQKRKILQRKVPLESKPTPSKKERGRGTGSTNHDKGLIIRTVYAKGGIVKYVAEALGVTRPTVYAWKKNHPSIKEAFLDAVEDNLDLTEHQLLELIKAQDLGAICFYAKCKGKTRGYIERMALEGMLGHDITIGLGLSKDDKADDYN